MIEGWFFKNGQYFCGGCMARRAMNGENGFSMRGFAAADIAVFSPVCVDCQARDEQERQRWAKKEG